MRVFFAVLVAASAICGLAQSSQPQDEQTPKLQHLDVTQVDSSVNPCDNFYQYTCGKLNAAKPIPQDQASWGFGGELREWNRSILRGILEKNAVASASRTPNEQKIGDLYATCMSQANSKADDLPAIRPLLARIDGMHDKREIAAVLAAIHSSFGRAWEGSDNQTDVAMFGYGPQADYNDVGRVVGGVDQGGLGMPSRDFYLKSDADSKAIRDKYGVLIVTLLKMGGASDANATRDAATVLRVETAMAAAQMDNIARRDPNKVNNRYTLTTLKELAPAFDWDGYFRRIGAPAVPLYEVSSPEFFRELNKLLVDEDLATWKAYLRWHLLRTAAPALGNTWRDASFAFDSVLTGQRQQPPDWRRCTVAADRYLGEALGQVYVAQVFPPESKARTLEMVKEIEAAMGRDIDSVSWMQPATKREAHLKLAAVMNKIGYPDNWIDYSSLTITRESYPANVERPTAFELKRQLTFIGKPLDRAQWLMTPPTLNAYEDPQTNTINFPAGILQPVFFDAGKDDVINYGAIGMVMGHELTHGFDDEGRKFDVKGNLRDWWTPEDAKAYEERGACIAKEYTGPVPGVAGVQQNGKLTQGEDTADNGGLYLALSALTEDLKQQGKTLGDKDEHGLTNLQRFFLAYGTSWCEQFRPELARTLVLSNPHSLPELRVNNVISNMPEFQQAFSCKAGQPMVHETRCRVW
ncbi:MAG TPA: M13 family metallopeptidase [Edaphobacter sp.]